MTQFPVIANRPFKMITAATKLSAVARAKKPYQPEGPIVAGVADVAESALLLRLRKEKDLLKRLVAEQEIFARLRAAVRTRLYGWAAQPSGDEY
jgi:hypothetical protein